MAKKSYPKTDKGQCRKAVNSDGRRTKSKKFGKLIYFFIFFFNLNT